MFGPCEDPKSDDPDSADPESGAASAAAGAASANARVTTADLNNTDPNDDVRARLRRSIIAETSPAFVTEHSEQRRKFTLERPTPPEEGTCSTPFLHRYE